LTWLSTLIRIVLGIANRGAVYPCPNLLELMDGSTSSRVATDYHWLTNLYNDPWSGGNLARDLIISGAAGRGEKVESW